MTYIGHTDEAKHKTRFPSRHFRGINTFLNLYIFYTLNNLDFYKYLESRFSFLSPELLVLRLHRHHHTTQKMSTNAAKYDKLSDFQGHCLFVKFDPSKYTFSMGQQGAQ